MDNTTPHRIENHNLQKNFYFHLFSLVSSVFCNFYFYAAHTCSLHTNLFLFVLCVSVWCVSICRPVATFVCILTALTPFSSEFKQTFCMFQYTQKQQQTPTTWLWCTMRSTTATAHSSVHIKVLWVDVSFFPSFQNWYTFFCSRPLHQFFFLSLSFICVCSSFVIANSSNEQQSSSTWLHSNWIGIA